MSNTHLTRSDFNTRVFTRDDNTCIVPWCSNTADDAHHILDRELWDDSGNYVDNGVSLCNHHHKHAETNLIPPQAFYTWAQITDPPIPDSQDTIHTDKWGEPFATPRWKDHKKQIKYQSTRHALPLYWFDSETRAKNRIEKDDTEIHTLDPFINIPLIITYKMDGSNCMLVNDVENPVRARNGSRPTDDMKPLYEPNGLYWQQQVNQKLPDNLQVFGEWLNTKHSIHYGCDCEPACEHVGPRLSDHPTIPNKPTSKFQIFGVYNTTFDVWLSWPTTKKIAKKLGFPTAPVIHEEETDTPTFTDTHTAKTELLNHAKNVIKNGGEGIVIRTKYPFHYGQFPTSLTKYVRENHVTTDTHWKAQQQPTNQ